MINKPLAPTKLSVVIPCYNEEEILDLSINKIASYLEGLKNEKIIDHSSLILLVDDGSSDRTWNIIQELSSSINDVFGIKLSRNFGHQSALLAGLKNVYKETDCTITIDADLQDDIAVIREMVIKYREGYDVVYGVRKERKTDTFFKRQTAIAFYKFIKLLGVEIVYNHADYRLASKRAINSLFDFEEVNLFLRGIFPAIGYESSVVYYDRLERIAGDSKYPFRKMLAFAIDGITSFSVKPLRVITVFGITISFVSVILSFYSLFSYFFLNTVPGWTSITLSFYFLSGIQLLCIGVLGEYIGKIYKETKRRPRFIIQESLLYQGEDQIQEPVRS